MLPALRQSTIPTPATPSPDYAPGRIRHQSDGELDAVLALTHDFPEYAKLPHDAIIDAAAGFRTDDRYEEIARLREAGVPADWRASGDEEWEGS